MSTTRLFKCVRHSKKGRKYGRKYVLKGITKLSFITSLLSALAVQALGDVHSDCLITSTLLIC